MDTMAGIAETKLATELTFPAPGHVRASLRLDFARDELTGRTMLAASHQQPPLRVVRAFAMEDGAAMVHLHNVSGGLLGGDSLGLTVNVGAEACAQITTTGATRIYRPRQESPVTTQSNEVAVGENALLEYLPDPLIPFAGTRFSQRTCIRLSSGAGLFWWEILSPGREAHGEIFEYASVELKTDLVAIGRPIAIERVRIEPENHRVASLARLGPYRTWATFYVCRVGLEASAWLALEQHLRDTAQRFCAGGESLWGISTLSAHGLVVRCVARQGRDVFTGLQALWQVAKLRLYGRDAVPPRKMN
jgi:urease accessory protein